MVTFSRAHSQASTNATRRHKYFRALSRLLPAPGVLVSFLEFFERLRAPSQSQKGHFSEKMKLKKWHQNSWHWQKSAQSLEIFVTSRGICQGVGMSSRKGEHFPFWTKKPVLECLSVRAFSNKSWRVGNISILPPRTLRQAMTAIKLLKFAVCHSF